MYQRNPSSTQDVGPKDRGPVPQSIQNAVKLMYGGAALSLISFIVSFATVGDLKTNIRKANPSWSAHQVSSTATGLIVYSVIIGLIGIGLWVLIAVKSGQGRNWARMTASVLFALYTISALALFRGHGTVFSLLVYGLTWLCGLGAVVMLWQTASSEFFDRMRNAA